MVVSTRKWQVQLGPPSSGAGKDCDKKARPPAAELEDDVDGEIPATVSQVQSIEEGIDFGIRLPMAETGNAASFSPPPPHIGENP